jgi:Cu(I)/Ag(I) efflux system membrane fusion protein
MTRPAQSSLLVTLAALSLATPARATTPVTAPLGDLTAAVSIDPERPRTGENHLTVTLRDVAGRPVDGAQLGFVWDMPAMGAMPEMKGAGQVRALGGGRYLVTYALAMNGDWFLSLGVDVPGHPHAELKMKVATMRPGITIEGAGAGDGGGGIRVSPERQQLIGVTWGVVEARPLSVTLRAAGRVEVDERNLADVTLKYEAYVEKLFVAETGKAVRRGQPLASVYSPDLLAAESEYLGAHRSGASGPLLEALERRLAYWDLSPAQIAAVANAGKADGRLTVTAPASGVVLDKAVVEGAHVQPGTALYRIGNLGRVWIQAAVYERDAMFVAVGQPARVSFPAMPAPYLARVTFVAPTVDPKTRTIEARLEVRNASLALRPGMFADVIIAAPLGTRLAVPDAALLMSGEHRYAFVDRGQGRLEPVEVQLGALAGDWDEVRGGLAAGDRVATGATFLLSSEAKLRDALPRWSPGAGAPPKAAP